MQVEKLSIPEVLLITPRRFTDARGFFAETWSRAAMAAVGLDVAFVQDNQSFSSAVGTLRGLHCQIPPFVQGKLVRVLCGAIWDVAVDARPGSPSFGRHAAAVLSAENFQQLWVPPGFLHGFVTLEPNTEILYKVTDIYDRAAERGVMWDDAELALPWMLPESGPVLSDKDRTLAAWPDAAQWFAECGATGAAV